MFRNLAVCACFLVKWVLIANIAGYVWWLKQVSSGNSSAVNSLLPIYGLQYIFEHILAANRCFHGLRKHLRSHLTSKKTLKCWCIEVLIGPVLTYASETWVLSKTNEQWSSLFKRKVHRCIFGAKREKETWRKRYSYELYEAVNEPNIVNYIKVNWLAWTGH